MRRRGTCLERGKMVNQKKLLPPRAMARWIERLLLERYTRGSIQIWVKPMTKKLVFVMIPASNTDLWL